MSPTAQQLLDAHVAYELSKLEEKELKKSVKEEVQHLWKWLGKVNIETVLPKAEVKAFVERNKKAEMTEPVRKYIIDLISDSHAYVDKQDWKVGDIVQKKDYDVVVERMLDMEEEREKLIHRMVRNPFYADLIANILYNGIKSFTTEGGALQKSPVGGLFKLGQGLMQASGLEDTIDTNVKKFISANLQKTLAQNEKYLKENLSNARLKKLANETWTKLEDTEIADLTKWVKPEALGESIPAAEEYWNDLTETKIFDKNLTFILDHFYKANGKKKVAEVLGDLNIDEKKAAEEAFHAALPWVNEMISSGYLEARIRARLEGFYSTQTIVK